MDNGWDASDVAKDAGTIGLFVTVERAEVEDVELDEYDCVWWGCWDCDDDVNASGAGGGGGVDWLDLRERLRGASESPSDELKFGMLRGTDPLAPESLITSTRSGLPSRKSRPPEKS